MITINDQNLPPHTQPLSNSDKNTVANPIYAAMPAISVTVVKNTAEAAAGSALTALKVNGISTPERAAMIMFKNSAPATIPAR